MWRGIIEAYRAFLPVTVKTPIVTLFEGNTPLLQAKRLCEALSLPIDLYLKYEGANPTGSFKDRGMTLAISKAKEASMQAVICASTGNTSASAAAFSAQAGLSAYVLVPEGRIAYGKLAQALVHGAKVIAVAGSFDQALTLVKEITQKYPIALVNSLNPYRLEGQKTASFEICDQLGEAPTYHALPVGNAGNITAYWRGYKEYYQSGRITSLPKMVGFQAAGAAPIVLGHVIDEPQTLATAIRIGNPASWKEAVRAAQESGGTIQTVTDNEMTEAYRHLAEREGLFCELASAASVAGTIKLAKQGIFKTGEKIVCTLTGHGLKDPDFAVGLASKPTSVQAELNDVLAVLGL